ncbi:cytochrome P450 [Streptomyces sp. enrichment culture]|uniref:cytochrome P450 n=1 Tax=Streptomyces sp. enrichment culture TaxID=1795815 RepID=UPI003F57CDF6
MTAFAGGQNPADLMRGYALPIPSQVICLILGVPYEDHQFFEEHSATLFEQSLPADRKQAALTALYAYTRRLLADRLTAPSPGLIGRQAVLTARGELELDEAAVSTMALLVAGHETTSSMIALSTLVLLQHPDQPARLRDSGDPTVVARAVEELLRYITTAETAAVRVATDEVEIGDHLVRKDEGLMMCLPSAHRDGEFAGADDLDLGRDARGHVAFGFGVHQCLGQNPARLELQIALPALLRRLPGLELAVPLEALRMRWGILSVDELPVTW